jgi:hypothetical protein
MVAGHRVSTEHLLFGSWPHCRLPQPSEFPKITIEFEIDAMSSVRESASTRGEARGG